MNVVHGAVEGAVAHDVLGKTNCVVKLLDSGHKTQLKSLQEKLRIIWNEMQMEQNKKIEHIATVEFSSKFSNTMFPCD